MVEHSAGAGLVGQQLRADVVVGGCNHGCAGGLVIPAILIHRFDDPRYHSAEDQAQFVDPQLLEEATELTLLALRGLGQP